MPEQDKYCPLCSGLNGCAVADGATAEDCWCHFQVFAPKTVVDSKNIPSTVCICQKCAKALSEEASKGIRRID
ncbi:cysteine-rich CWC family protein [Shewanella sp. Isolate11]|uniref:cysteine-rich CWC family protein n=1 Tax=Shewanella sp. Isolate11 TaxID=2908530 RepID=UPI001EFE885D|nr:cysteine-rich CWC family protein [Shewanella sp. Isolate11]MCG9695585.1 cysteine-rich CWC family protein [Shewanella sp. Isolate11]